MRRVPGSVRIASVRGVPVGVHWSLVAVVVLVGTGLAQRQLPTDLPGHGAAAYWAAGALATAGLVVGVLAHEAGHAVVGRRAGLEVDGITLSWLGGMTRMRGDAPGPGWQAAVAGAGPAVSLVIGAVALGAGRAVGGGLAGATLAWIGLIHLALGVANLLPAAPLDGGRVLAAGLWRLSGDRWRAAGWAATCGRVLAGVVAAVAVVRWMRGDAVNGVVLGGLAWWLAAASRSEATTAAIGRCVAGATVAQLMRPVGAAPGYITLRAFLDRYDAARPGWVWLLEGWGGGYTAVVSGDAVRAVPVGSLDHLRPVDVGIPVRAVGGAAPGDDAMEALARSGGGAVLLVVDGGATVGAVLPGDVADLVAAGRRVAPAAG